MTDGSNGVRQLQTELAVLVRRVREVIKVAAVDVHPDLNVTAYATLLRLVDEGPQRASALVDLFGTDKGSMSRQLANLETLGLVCRTRDPADGRAQVVRATATAVRRCAKARDRSRTLLQDRITGWDEQQIDEFAQHLHEFNTALARDEPGTSR